MKSCSITRKVSYIAGLAVLIMITVTTGACSSKDTSQPEIPPDPFSIVINPEDEHVVTLTGNSAGHVPGETSQFFLRLRNNTNQVWQGKYIVQLLDNNGIVMDIAHESFSVFTGVESEEVISTEFSSDLEGPYGLSLYIPDLGSQCVHTIWLGQKSTEEEILWPTTASHPWLWSDAVHDER